MGRGDRSGHGVPTHPRGSGSFEGLSEEAQKPDEYLAGTGHPQPGTKHQAEAAIRAAQQALAGVKQAIEDGAPFTAAQRKQLVKVFGNPDGDWFGP